MIRALLLILMLFAVLTGCSDGDDDGDSDGDRPRVERTERADDGENRVDESDLESTVEAAYKAIFASGAVDAYAYASQEFKDSCSLGDFIGVVGFVRIFLGEIDEDDVEVDVTDTREEDGRTFVTVEVSLRGEELDLDDGGDDLTEYWVREDGAWRFGTDDEDPCDMGGVTIGDGDDDEPATGPGSSRAEPIPLGETVESGDQRITVLSADTDAVGELERLSDFPSTPVPGRRVVLARVRVEHIGEEGDDTIMVFSGDYKITGSGDVLYDSFGEGASCGFLRDELSGEMFPGGSIEGYVCFQVPEEETELLLVASPGFDGDGRRFLALE